MTGKPGKFDDLQIENGALSDLGKRIATHLAKMRQYEAEVVKKAGVALKKADDHCTSVAQLLAEAKTQCRTEGFKAFQEKYAPDFSRSRLYELLAIGSGNKTEEDVRAESRARKAKSRAGASVTTSDVTDKMETAVRVHVVAEPEPKPTVVAVTVIEDDPQVSADRQKQYHAADDDNGADVVADDAEASSMTDQANAFHGELMETFTDFQGRLRTWFQSRDLDKGAKEMMNEALYLIADGLMQLAQEMDGR
jgi:hypothetical protein